MELSQNQYRKFLVDIVMASSNVTASYAFAEVNEFMKTNEFHDSYKKWAKWNIKFKKGRYGPRSINEIIFAMEGAC